jgi:hypothetical protein
MKQLMTAPGRTVRILEGTGHFAVVSSANAALETLRHVADREE